MMHFQPQRKQQFQAAEGMGEHWFPHMDARAKISTYQEFFYMLVTKTHLFFQEKSITAYRVQNSLCQLHKHVNTVQVTAIYRLYAK